MGGVERPFCKMGVEGGGCCEVVRLCNRRARSCWERGMAHGGG